MVKRSRIGTAAQCRRRICERACVVAIKLTIVRFQTTVDPRITRPGETAYPAVKIQKGTRSQQENANENDVRIVDRESPGILLTHSPASQAGIVAANSEPSSAVLRECNANERVAVAQRTVSGGIQ